MDNGDWLKSWPLKNDGWTMKFPKGNGPIIFSEYVHFQGGRGVDIWILKNTILYNEHSFKRTANIKVSIGMVSKY